MTTLTLTQTWLPWTGGYWNTPAWSLGVEAFFYALFPLALGWWMRRTDRQLVLAAVLA